MKYIYLVLSFLLFTVYTNSLQAQKNFKQNNPGNTPLMYKLTNKNPLDSVLSQSVGMANLQAREILALFFEKKVNENGDTIYEPIVITMSMDRQVITMDSIGNPQTQTVNTYFSVPLITLAPIHMVGINEATIDANGDTKIKLDLLPLPQGLNTIIQAFTKSIEPIIQ